MRVKPCPAHITLISMPARTTHNVMQAVILNALRPDDVPPLVPQSPVAAIVWRRRQRVPGEAL